MFSNRLSFFFDFRGPSFTVDTACSSSLLAMQLALDAIRKGDCEAALVAGAHVTLCPQTTMLFQRLGMLSPDGICRPFDNGGIRFSITFKRIISFSLLKICVIAANGFVRAEAVSAILLQRHSSAKRCYATVVHAKSNTDGHKPEGITFPGWDRQMKLIEECYREAAIDAMQVTYIEAHGTGTPAGDPQVNLTSTFLLSDHREYLL